MAAESVPQTLLEALTAAESKLWMEAGDRLKASAPNEALTPELWQQIGTYKAALVTRLKQVEQTQTDAIAPVARTNPLPLSFAQQRLWFLDQMETARTAYNIPLTFRLQGLLRACLIIIGSEGWKMMSKL